MIGFVVFSFYFLTFFIKISSEKHEKPGIKFTASRGVFLLFFMLK